MQTQSKNKPTVLRSVSLPGQLLQQIKRIAKDEHRSVSGQIVFFLDSCVTRRVTADNAIHKA